MSANFSELNPRATLAIALTSPSSAAQERQYYDQLFSIVDKDEVGPKHRPSLC